MLSTSEATSFSSPTSSTPSFLERIGSPRFVMAPMVGQSELAFRLFCKRYGCQVGYTPMIWSERFVLDAKYREEAFQTTEDDSDRPLVVQFCGDDPQTLLKAALLIQDRCDAVDINLGCPQELAKQHHFGSYLCGRKDWKLVEEIVSTLSQNLRVPVCCKIRKLSEGGNSEKQNQLTIEFAKVLQRAGCSLLAVHARTKEQNRFGRADWDLIRTIKQELTIPVIANGNIHNHQDLEECLRYTQADAVMSAEALLANPALFSPLPSSQLPSSCQLAREYITLAMEPRLRTNFKYIRQHVSNMLVEYLAPHRRSYLKQDSTSKPKNAHADLWFKLKEADTLKEIEQLIQELERRLSFGIKFTRKKPTTSTTTKEGEEGEGEQLIDILESTNGLSTPVH